MRRRIAALAAAALFLFASPVGSERVQAAHVTAEADFAQIPETPIFMSSGVSAEEAYGMTLCYLMVPENVRARLAADGVKIYLIAYGDEVLRSSRLSAHGGAGLGVAGLTTHPVYQRYVFSSTGQLAYAERVKNGMIEIQTDVRDAVKIDPFRLQHEIGHYVDTAAGAAEGSYFAISSGEVWQVYYRRFGQQLLAKSAYAAAPTLYNAQECWADAFRLAWSDPAALQAISPELLAYVASETLILPAAEPQQGR
ncbi:hypothetical protein [Lachnoclostridium sp. Marseille-P6806]|uniref:hypothetical protein n=1 Tax=Lachnoclostridium sp. Marseille-P6806 TaxID=2364793 RepID=UPI00102FB9C0|nr:hypothetical protein [Lachnoclostridium sp. Marseille-P6806]